MMTMTLIISCREIKLYIFTNSSFIVHEFQKNIRKKTNQKLKQKHNTLFFLIIIYVYIIIYV